jgi:hypothetical protein
MFSEMLVWNSATWYKAPEDIYNWHHHESIQADSVLRTLIINTDRGSNLSPDWLFLLFGTVIIQFRKYLIINNDLHGKCTCTFYSEILSAGLFF